MDRINSVGTILDQYGHRIRQDMDLQTGAPGTELSSAYDNSAQEELVGGLIEAMGLVPSAQSVRQIQQAIWLMVQQQESAYAVDTSATADQITVALTPAPIALIDGMPIRFKAANSNAGKTTLTIVGATQSWTVPLVSAAGVLQGGEIIAGCIYDGRYNAAAEDVVIVGYGGGAVPVGPATAPNQAVQLGQLNQQIMNLSANGSGTISATANFSTSQPCYVHGFIAARNSANGNPVWNSPVITMNIGKVVGFAQGLQDTVTQYTDALTIVYFIAKIPTSDDVQLNISISELNSTGSQYFNATLFLLPNGE